MLYPGRFILVESVHLGVLRGNSRHFSCIFNVQLQRPLMLCKKVCSHRARRRPANQKQAKQTLTPVIIMQLAPSWPGISGRQNSNAV